MAKTVQYWGTVNYQELPLTGRLVTWTPKQKQEVPDAIATLLLAAGVGFLLDNDNNGELAVYATDSSGNVTGLVGGGGNVFGLSKRCVFFGDSITANGAAAGGQTSEWNAYTAAGGASSIRGWASFGWQTWLMRLLGQPFNTDITGLGADGMSGSPGGNQAVSSQTSYDMIVRLPHLVSARPDIVFLHLGTNDIGNLNVSLSATFPHTVAHTPTMAGLFSNFQQILNTALTVAQTVVVVGIIPRNSSAVVTRNMQQYRKYQKELCAQYKSVIYVDPWEFVVDQASSTGYPVSANMQDGVLHPSAKGAYLMAQAVYNSIQYLFPPINPQLITASYSDAYDSTSNPYGNLLSNQASPASIVPNFSGTTGTIQSTGTGGSVSGQVPTGWTFKSTNNGDQLTGLCTTAALNGVTYNVCELTVTNTTGTGTAGSTVTFTPTGAFNGSTAMFSGAANTNWATAGNFVIGDRFQAECLIDIIDSAFAQQLAIALTINDGITANTRRRYDGVYSSSYTNSDGFEILPVVTAGNIRLKLRTPVITSLGIDTFGGGSFASMVFGLILGINGTQTTSKIHIRVWPPSWHKLPPQVPLFNSTLTG